MSTESESDERPRRESDAPLDLSEQREAFVRSFLKKGVEFTEQLIKENSELRAELVRLGDDNARLRAHVASDDAIRDLLRTIERLELEKKELLTRSNQLEESYRRNVGRYVEIEQELNDLANLYIASFQLHTSFSTRRVSRHLADIVGQLVGAEGFAIYVVAGGANGPAKELRPIAHEGLESTEVVPLAVDNNVIADACSTGISRIRPASEGPGSLQEPLAVIPMMVDGRSVGAIAIVRLLEQKSEWASVDHELFKLLSAHAGAALVAANLYSEKQDPESAVTGLVEKL